MRIDDIRENKYPHSLILILSELKKKELSASKGIAVAYLLRCLTLRDRRFEPYLGQDHDVSYDTRSKRTRKWLI
jgi:hypothetical protein